MPPINIVPETLAVRCNVKHAEKKAIAVTKIRNLRGFGMTRIVVTYKCSTEKKGESFTGVR